MYTLKEPIDLSRHRGTAYLHQPRDDHGRFAPTGAAKVGKHLEYTTETRRLSSRYSGPDGSESVDYNELFSKVSDTSLPLSEREKAVNQATLHLQHLKHQVSTAEGSVKTEKASLHLKGASTSVDKTMLRVTQTLKGAPKVQKAEEFTKDAYTDTARVSMTSMAIKVGAAAASGAASLLGVQESEKFSEAFERLTEYPGVESAINMALTLLITGLIARIIKKWREKRDRAIAEARGEVKD